jgi:hypothetical protein
MSRRILIAADESETASRAMAMGLRWRRTSKFLFPWSQSRQRGLPSTSPK